MVHIKLRDVTTSGATVTGIRFFNSTSTPMNWVDMTSDVTGGALANVGLSAKAHSWSPWITAQSEAEVGPFRWGGGASSNWAMTFETARSNSSTPVGLCPRGAVGRLYLNPGPGSNTIGNTIERLYQAYFLRPSDKSGRDYWLEEFLLNGVSVERISNSFANSYEFRVRYGRLSNRQFVEQIYRNVLGRQGDSGGVAYWTWLLNTGTSRGDVMLAFSDSAEFRNRTGLR